MPREENVSPKKILYIDMDNVLADFESVLPSLPPSIRKEYKGRLDEVPGIFILMNPMPGAIKAFQELAGLFDVYILSTAPWRNPSAWSDKLIWVKKHLGDLAYKRLILSHHKNLNRGDYLIDDRLKNGSDLFTGELIPFGSKEFSGWPAVLSYLRKRV